MVANHLLMGTAHDVVVKNGLLSHFDALCTFNFLTQALLNLLFKLLELIPVDPAHNSVIPVEGVSSREKDRRLSQHW